MSDNRESKGCLWPAVAAVGALVPLFFALPFVGWMAVGLDSPDPVDRYDVTAADFRDGGEKFLRRTTAAVSPGLVFHDSGYEVERNEPGLHQSEASKSSHVRRVLTARTVVLVGHEGELERRVTDAWFTMGCPLATVDARPESGSAGAGRILRTTDPNGVRAELSLEESRMSEPGPRTVRVTITIDRGGVQYAPDAYGDLAAGHVAGSRPGDPADVIVDPYWSH